jgi:methyl-accepting chemotaxis protein
MTTRVATALVGGPTEEAAAAATKAIREQLGKEEPAFALIFASTEQPLGKLQPILQRNFPSTVLLGASTAGEFTERGDRKSGVSVVAVAGDFVVHGGISRGLAADPEAALATITAKLPASIDGKPHRTGLLLLDPLAGRGEETTLLAAALLGADVPLAGGAAGDDLKMTSTTVGFGSEVATDAVVLAVIYSTSSLGVGVSHGHLPISGALTITRAEGNVVYEIDGRPAWEVWVERTRDAAQRAGIDAASLPADQVGAFLLRYEAGLSTGDAYKIRAPLSRGADGSLSFACGIPKGAVIRITESEPDRQVASATEAARRARARISGTPAGAIVFDCICRNLILGERFHTAVDGISRELDGAPVAGFETYGEIALDAGDMSGFHNTTTVVLAIPR